MKKVNKNYYIFYRPNIQKYFTKFFFIGILYNCLYCLSFSSIKVFEITGVFNEGEKKSLTRINSNMFNLLADLQLLIVGDT